MLAFANGQSRMIRLHTQEIRAERLNAKSRSFQPLAKAGWATVRERVDMTHVELYGCDLRSGS